MITYNDMKRCKINDDVLVINDDNLKSLINYDEFGVVVKDKTTYDITYYPYIDIIKI